jgi:hypothetical protein
VIFALFAKSMTGRLGAQIKARSLGSLGADVPWACFIRRVPAATNKIAQEEVMSKDTA